VSLIRIDSHEGPIPAGRATPVASRAADELTHPTQLPAYLPARGHGSLVCLTSGRATIASARTAPGLRQSFPDRAIRVSVFLVKARRSGQRKGDSSLRGRRG